MVLREYRSYLVRYFKIERYNLDSNQPILISAQVTLIEFQQLQQE
jgi:hypothetical protein